MPLVSIIVTTYNRIELLKETIYSIISQSFTDFEVIVVDNFSNYDFFNLINSFQDDRLVPFQNLNNGIIGINRNFGIKKASGKFLAFCDDDDVWVNNKLEKQIQYINNFLPKGVNNFVLYTNTFCFGENIKGYTTKKKNVKNISDFYRFNQITYSTVLVSRNEFVKFSEEVELVAVEDYKLWMELICNDFSFYLLPDPLVNYRVNANSQFREAATYSYLKMILALLKVYIIKKPKISVLFFSISIIFCLLKFSVKCAILNLKSKN